MAVRRGRMGDGPGRDGPGNGRRGVGAADGAATGWGGTGVACRRRLVPRSARRCRPASAGCRRGPGALSDGGRVRLVRAAARPIVLLRRTPRSVPERLDGPRNAVPPGARLDVPELAPSRRQGLLPPRTRRHVDRVRRPPPPSPLPVRRSPRPTASRCPSRTPTAVPAPMDTASVGADRGPHPLTAWAHGTPRAPGRGCQDAGTYYVLVERVTRPRSSPDDWELELAHVLGAAALKRPVRPSAPEVLELRPALPCAPARPRAAAGRRGLRRGDAPWARESGATTSCPGRRCSTGCPWTGDSSSTPPPNWAVPAATTNGLVARALIVSLYNPVRGLRRRRGASVYDGSQTAAALDRCRRSSTTTVTTSRTG